MIHHIFCRAIFVISFTIQVWITSIQTWRVDNDQQNRIKLEMFYKTVEGDWKQLTAYVARATERFYAYILGERLVSLRSLGISVGSVLRLDFGVLKVTEGRGDILDKNFWLMAMSSALHGPIIVYLANALIDFSLLTLCRVYLRRAAKKPPKSLLLSLAVFIAFTSISFGAGMLVITLSDLIVLHQSLPNHFGPHLQRNVFGFFHNDGSSLETRCVVGPAMASSLLYLLDFLGAALVYYSRQFTQGPLLAILSKIKSNNMTVLNSALVVVTMDAGLATFFY
jgi:hypothetical protein